MAIETDSYDEHPMDALDPETSRHPQPSYKALRDAAAVLHIDGVGWLVSTRVAVDQVLRDPATFSSAVPIGSLSVERPLIPLQIDPPDHKKFRKLLDPLFAPQRMKLLEGPLTALANDLIDRLAGAEEIDFARQFSIPFPSQAFLTLLGLPFDELPELLRMKDGIIRPQHVIGKPVRHPETRAYQQATARSIYEYFERVLDRRKLEPGEDLLSTFLAAEIDGDRLSRDDILDICFLFMIAGLDTVSASLDCFFFYLAEHAERRKEIVEGPSLITAVVEELLRWETPVVAVARVTAKDTLLGGCPITAGQPVMVLLGSANTDESDLPDADVVRWDRQVNRHRGFGGGIHRCLGSHLARIELRVALRVWHERLPDYQVKPGAELAFTNGIRSLDTFPMLLGSSA
jgi:cytochrome P450